VNSLRLLLIAAFIAPEAMALRAPEVGAIAPPGQAATRRPGPVDRASGPGTSRGPSLAPIRLERLGSEHGLSHNTVYAIQQDSRGFIWLGTQDGLDRYDGYEFLTYKHDPADSRSLASNWVAALLEDRDQRLWVGTRAGLQRMTTDGHGFERFRLEAPADREPVVRFVTSLAEAPDGTLWVGTDRGLFTLDPTRMRVRAFSHDPADPASLAADMVRKIRVAPDGVVWVLTEGAGFQSTLNRYAHTFERIPVPHTWAFALAASGDFWLDPRHAVSVAGLRSGDADLARATGIAALAEDSFKRLWVGTYEGLYIRTPEDGVLRLVATAHLGAGALAGEVNDIVQDRAGAVWIGTFGGILRHDPRSKAFDHLEHRVGDPNRLASNAVSAVYQEPGGRLWVGTYGAGLEEVDRGTGRIVHHRRRAGDPTSLCGNYIWDVAASARVRLWIGTSTGLCSLEGGRFRRHPLPPELVSPLSVLEGPDGTLWLGSATGLYRYDVDQGTVRFAGDARAGLIPSVDTLHLDRTGRLWMGSGGWADLASYDPVSGKTARFSNVAPNGIWDIDAGADDALWLATGTGLVRFDPAAGRAHPIRLEQDEGGSVHYGVLIDAEGRVWAGTNKGLVRYDPSTSTSRRYDLGDGIGNVEFNRHAAFRNAQDGLFFGGMSGVTSFAAADIHDNPWVPPVVLTGIKTLSDAGEGAVSPFGLDVLTLTAAHYTVSFEFAALNFTQGHKNRYAYTLEGFDRAWIQAGTRRSARYTNLPPGRYVFRVRGSNNDGIWNDRGAALPVMVLPPYWQTWWFRLALAAALVVSLAAAYKLRIRRIRELERLRLQIASDLHDELGSELSGIALASSLIGRQDHLTDRDRRRLADVASAATRVMLSLRDIVWYINPEQDTLESLEARMRSVARTLLAGVPHEFRSSGITPTPIDMDERGHVFLIYKELLHNIVRHARARRVTIRLDATDETLELRVSDDGIGFDGSGRSGTGLRNIRQRVAAIGGNLRIEGRPGEGTNVCLTVRMTRTRRIAVQKTGVQ
jgi:ligand-binding sensor domain-containing protein/signal transduction histidine kinase